MAEKNRINTGQFYKVEMLGAVVSWASGLFSKGSADVPTAVPTAVPLDKPTGKKTLWALVEWADYTENHAVFLTANGTDLNADKTATHDYFNVVGVPANRWTYSVEKPAEEPAGKRWIPLAAGFGLRVRMA
jgi:hypothetical protein